MPLYKFQCPNCPTAYTVFRKIDERNDAPRCVTCTPEQTCRNPMQRVIEAPAVQTDIPGYQSPIDGRWIEGRRARTEDLKRNGCRPWEGMETERREAEQRAEEADRVFEKQTEAGLHETLNNMSAEKQRVLASAFD